MSVAVPTQPRAGGCGGQPTQGGVRRAVSSSAMLAACRHGWGGVDTATAASRFLWPKTATRTPANTTAASRRSPPPAPSPAHCIGSAVWLHLHHHRVLTPNDARWVEAAQSGNRRSAITRFFDHELCRRTRPARVSVWGWATRARVHGCISTPHGESLDWRVYCALGPLVTHYTAAATR